MAAKINHALIVAGICLAFFPFVSPVPMDTDVQLPFFIVATLCIAARRHIAAPCLVQSAFLPIIALALIYFPSFNLWYPTDAIRLTFALIAFSFFRMFALCALSQKLVLVLASANFVFIGLHFMAPSIFVAAVEGFLRVIKISEIGLRGASGLAPEPGFAGAVSVAMLATSMFLKDFTDDKRYYSVILLLAIVSVGLTRSGTGSLLLIVVSVLYYARSNLWNLLVFAIVAYLVYLAAQYFELGRGFQAMELLLQNPGQALMLDGSIGARALNFLIGIYAVVEAPLGHGFGTYTDAANVIASQHRLWGVTAGWVGDLSAFARYSVQAGLFWWLFLLLMYGRALQIGRIRALPYLVLSLLFLAASFSVAFPLTWLFPAMLYALADASPRSGRPDVTGRHRIHADAISGRVRQPG